jgi:hypothetical protein
MIEVDKAPGVKLVTDPVPGQLRYKAAGDLAPGDVIAIPFAGYGDLHVRITNTQERGGLVDVTVTEPNGFGYTTAIKADTNVTVYAPELEGTWRR